MNALLHLFQSSGRFINYWTQGITLFQWDEPPISSGSAFETQKRLQPEPSFLTHPLASSQQNTRPFTALHYKITSLTGES